MKKLMMAVCACVCALGAFGDEDVKRKVVYVATTGADAEGRGGSEAPYASIKYAIANNEAPLDVMVADGTYNMVKADFFSIAADVRVIGESRDNTILYYKTGDSGSAFITLNNAAASVQNVTVKFYKATWMTSGNGAAFDIAAGTVSNVLCTSCGTAYSTGVVNLRGDNAYFCDSVISSCKLWSTGRCMLSVSAGLAERIRITKTYTDYSNNPGHGVYMTGANAVVRDCLIDGANLTAAISQNCPAAYVSKGLLENCTIVNNYVKSSPNTGLYVGSTDAEVRNCIIYGNRGADVSTINVAAADADALAKITYSCCPDLPAAVNDNLTLDPRFTDAANGDYSLQGSSPCINLGADTDATLDFAGNPRKYNGSRPDMGCYEYQGEPESTELIVSFSPTVAYGQNELDTTFNATVIGARGASMTYEWDFGDGSSIAYTAVPTADHHYSAPGEYTVVLACNDGFLTGVCTNTCIFVNSDDPVRYVNINNPTPKYPYSTPETACRDFDTVWTLTPAPEEIHVAAGTYIVTPSKRVYTLDRAVKVIGDDSDAVKFFANEGAAAKSIFTLDHEDALLAGVRLEVTGNKYSDSAPAGLDIVSGTASNVLVYGCGSHNVGAVRLRGANARFVDSRMTHCESWSAGIGVLYITEGLADRITLTNNVEHYSNVYETALRLNGVNAVCRNSFIARNSAGGGNATDLKPAVRVTKGLLENCTVVNNNAGNGGNAGVYVGSTDGVVRNCIITGNKGADVSTINVAAANADCLANVTCSCSPDLMVGVNGNLTLDPVFTDAAHGDYSLQETSPCINLGADTDAPLDYVRNPRKYNGSLPDMGCYEFQGEPVATEMIVSFAPTVSHGHLELDTTFIATVVGARGAIGYEWDFGDGSQVEKTDAPTADHHYSAPGEYTVVLSCDDGFLTGVCTNTCIFVNSDDPVRYVNASCPTPKYPYTTPETASHDFEAIWTMDPAPAEIHVGPGTYTVNPTKQVYVLDRAVKVIGDDPDTVRFYSPIGDAGKAVFTLNHEDAFLSGVTVECQNPGNWMATPPGGIDIIGGTVSNVLVTKSTSHESGSVALHGPNARFVDSRISKCSILSAGKGVLLISEGLADRVTVENTTTAYDNLSCTGILLQGTNAVCRNSLIFGNACGGGSATAVKPAVRVTKGVLENCTVVNNNAGNGANAGIYVAASADAVVRNCISFGNLAKGGETTKNVMLEDGASVSHCCSPDLEDGVNGNVSADPQFQTVNGFAYGFRSSSPCFGAGEKLGWMKGALDYLRQPRLINAPEIGCFESQSKGLLLMVK